MRYLSASLSFLTRPFNGEVQWTCCSIKVFGTPYLVPSPLLLYLFSWSNRNGNLATGPRPKSSRKTALARNCCSSGQWRTERTLPRCGSLSVHCPLFPSRHGG